MRCRTCTIGIGLEILALAWFTALPRIAVAQSVMEGLDDWADPTPAGDRTYNLEAQYASFKDLLDDFAFQAGLALVGPVPRGGDVQLTTHEGLTFDDALIEIRMTLLWRGGQAPHWLIADDATLKVIKVADMARHMPEDLMFPSIEAFLEADVAEQEFVVVTYAPRAQSLEPVQRILEFLPAYVQARPIEDQNAVTVSGLAADIDRFLELLEFFEGDTEDPRDLHTIDVENVPAARAARQLRALMDLQQPTRKKARGRRRAPRRRRRPAPAKKQDALAAPPPVIMPDNARGVIIVRAMPNVVEEIESLLPLIDVAGTTTAGAPVFLDVHHGTPAKIVQTLQAILKGSATTRNQTAARARSRRPARGHRRRRQAKGTRAFATVEGISLMPCPTRSAIAVLAEDEDVDRVRELIDLLDVETQFGPIEIELEHADATALVQSLRAILNAGDGRGKAATQTIKAAADRTGGSIWISGPQRDLDTVLELVAQLDVPGAEVELITVDLTVQQPSYMASVLRAHEEDQGGATTKSIAKRKRPRRRRRPRGRRAAQSTDTVQARFIGDDKAGRLYVVCTAAEWEEYEAIIEEFEGMADSELAPDRLELLHLDADEAIEKINFMLKAIGSPHADLELIPRADGLLVFGASPLQLRNMQAFLAEIDVPRAVEQTQYELQYLDPDQAMIALRAYLGEAPKPKKRSPRRRGRRARPVRRQVPRRIETDDVFVVRVDNLLTIEGTPDAVEDMTLLLDRMEAADEAHVVHEVDMPTIVSEQALAVVQSHMREIHGAEADEIRYSRVNGSILVTGATEEQVDDIEMFLSGLGEEVELAQQVFRIEHADPADIVLAINAFVRDQSSAQPKRKPNRRRGRNKVTRTGVQQDITTETMRITQVGRQLAIEATPSDMEAIAELMEELDTPDLGGAYRLYDDLSPETDVVELARALVETFGGTVHSKPSKTKRRGKKRQGRGRRTQQGERLRFTPRPLTHSLLVHGEESQFAAIEAFIEAYDQHDPVEETDVTFVDVEHADPVAVVESICPLLRMKVQELAARGVLSDAPQRERPRRRGVRSRHDVCESTYYRIAPDATNRRIAIGAPQVIADQVIELVGHFDAAEGSERILHTVELSQADPSQVVGAVAKLLGAPPKRSAARRRSRKRRHASARQAYDSVSIGTLSICVAPGDGGIALAGTEEEVERAEEQIRRLDAAAVADRVVNVHTLEHVDAVDMARLIAGIVDAPIHRRPRRPQVPREDADSSHLTWKGQHTYMEADSIAGVLMVVADSGTQAEVDKIVAELDIQALAGLVNDPTVPTMVYEPAHIDAMDCSWNLELVLDALWDSDIERPTVELGPFDGMLVIRHPSVDRLAEVGDLIAEYVDRVDPDLLEPACQTMSAPRGATPEQLVRWLRTQNPNLEIEVVRRLDMDDEDHGLERMEPTGDAGR